MTENALPEKFSDGILLALADLKAAELNPEYRIAMHTWHAPRDGQCVVCFAGSVMAGTLGCDIDKEFDPADFGGDIAGKLTALDYVRVGHIATAVERYMGWAATRDALDNISPANRLTRLELISYKTVPDYALDRAGWERALREIAAGLADLGL